MPYTQKVADTLKKVVTSVNADVKNFQNVVCNCQSNRLGR